jgi:hypothetical protein
LENSTIAWNAPIQEASMNKKRPKLCRLTDEERARINGACGFDRARDPRSEHPWLLVLIEALLMLFLG